MLTPLRSQDRAVEIEQRLVAAIEMGAFGDGEQLPSEAALAAQLGVAPVTLREALAGLRDAGFLETRRGRAGGSFVRNPESERRQRLLARLAEHGPDDLRDGGDIHAAVASAGARYAAERATPADHRRLQLRVELLAEAATPTLGLLADRRFHLELSTASGSLTIAREEARLQAELSALTWLLFTPDRIAAAAEEHGAILDAVVRGRGGEAADLMRAHLGRETEELVTRRLALVSPPTGDPGTRSAEERGQAVLDAVDAAAAEIFSTLGRVRELLADTLATTVHAARALAPEDLAGFERLVRVELGKHPGLTGMGMALDPVQGALTWAWWQPSEDGPAPLLVNLDRDNPEYYDYAIADWYARPRNANTAWLAGPFVDFGGADDHILTFTLPVRVGGAAEPVGVVGADVAVREVEQITAAPLAAIDTPAVLVNREGVVIATNTGTHLPGTTLSGWTSEDALTSATGLGLRVVSLG